MLVFDVSVPSVVPIDWHRKLYLIALLGKRIVKRGRGAGSMESEENAGLNYRVTTTSGIRKACDWAQDFAEHLGREAGAMAGIALKLDVDKEYAMNLNYIETGGRYELHEDLSADYTMVVFLSEHRQGSGGLAIYPRSRRRDPSVKPKMVYTPKIGKAVLMKNPIPHEVMRVFDAPRATFILAFDANGEVKAPPDLNYFLYEGSDGQEVLF